MREQLTKVWKHFETKQLAKVFEEYMKSIGVLKRNLKKESEQSTNTYYIDGKSCSWNRVQCYYHKEFGKFGSENINLVLRKRAGNYFLIERYGKRIFEVDYHGVIEYNDELVQEAVSEHKPLFDRLFEIAG